MCPASGYSEGATAARGRTGDTTLMVRYKGKNIAEVLDLTIEDALEFFKAHPKIRRIPQTLVDVGLDYTGQFLAELL